MSSERSKTCRILIVDDSDHDRAEAKAALLNGSPRRWEILEASYGEEALRLCALEPAFDCVVFDFDLPDATALQVLAAMARDEHDLIRIPAVILTCSTSATASQEVLRAGAQDYVGKSWLCPESLTWAVDNAMERHAITRALRAKERELRAVTDNSPDILTRHDRDLRCVFVNEAISRATGQPVENFIGKTNREIGLAPQACARWDSAIQHVLDTGEAQSFEMEFTRLGEVRYFECRLIAENRTLGERQHVIGITHDITEQRQQALRREQLLEAERAARVEGERVALIKDEFLATVTHELRTPLASIISWSSLLKMSLKNEAMVARCIEVIVGSASEQAALIADLLDMNRIVSGKMRMESELVDVDQVAASAAETLSLTVAAKGLSLELTLGCGPDVRIRGDAGRLRQVLWNLLTNAVKFSPSGGNITLATAVVGDEVTIRVSDNGSGIDPAYMPFLFDRFTQADGSRARLHGGLGLGLSIVKSLVESHGGTVVASSAGPGQGASFMLRFPMPDAAAQALALQVEPPATLTLDVQDAGTERTGVLQGVSILVVDDVSVTLAFLQRLLSDAGATVRVAGSAKHALDQITSCMPDVLLSDIGMPGTDGYQLLEQIRRDMGLSAECLPAAAVTAYTRPQDHSRALQAGYQACIQKPVNELLLIRTVLALLEMKTPS